MVMGVDAVVVPTVVPVVVTTVEAPVVTPVVVIAWAVPKWTIEVIVRPIVIVDVDVGITVVPIRSIIVPVGAIVVVAPITTTKVTPVAVIPVAVVVPIGSVPTAWPVDIIVVIVVDDVVAIAAPTTDPRWTVGDSWQIIVSVVDSASVSTRAVTPDRRTIRFCGGPTTCTWIVRTVQSTLTRSIPADVRAIAQSWTGCWFGGTNTTPDISTEISPDVARKRVRSIHTSQRWSIASG